MTDTVPIDELAQTLRDDPSLQLAVLFGSAARGELRADSDIDIGIVTDDRQMALADEVALQARLERVCHRPVDVVRLDRASSFLLGQIARDARLLFERAPGALARFRAHALNEWLDFAPAFEHAARQFRRRLVEIAPRQG